MGISFYVYYRVDPRSESIARARVALLLEQLQRNSGVSGRLFKKRGENALWMEVYEEVSDPVRFEACLKEAVRELRMSEVLDRESSRHIEAFEEQNPCV